MSIKYFKTREHGDVLGFLHDHHDQGGDDGKGAHQDDHGQDDGHGRLLQLEGREEVLVHFDPVAHVERKAAQGVQQTLADGLDVVYVADPVFDAGYEVSLEAQDFLGLGDRNYPWFNLW